MIIAAVHARSNRHSLPRRPLLAAAMGLLSVWSLSAGQGAPPAGQGAPAADGRVSAIVGATLIDGNGGPPVKNATIVITGTRISAIGPRASVSVPAGASVIDGKGKFVTPGFIDTNVHLSLYGGSPNDRYETAVKFWDRHPEVVLETAQRHLKHGVTTVRDSYGLLVPLTQVRDRIARGEAVGPRVLVAGNIVGWGGPFSVSFGLIREQGLTLFQERFNDFITQGAGEELMDMTPGELRVAINTYLDKGPDFLKYGGTSHWAYPTFIGFSPEAQQVLVEETHKRGRVAEIHSTSPEGLRLSLLAGIDLVQHPELLADREMPDDLVALFKERGAIASMLVNTITGSAWKRGEKQRTEAEKKRVEAEKEGGAKDPRTAAERRQRASDEGVGLRSRRTNALKLIAAGVTVTLGTDNYLGAAPEFRRTPKPDNQEPGIGTIVAIEGLVELGMTPSQAIVSATKNGALAARGLKDFGTLEAGKLADLLLLDADPLADISNIRKLHLVMRDGRVIDRAALPTNPVFDTRTPPAAGTAAGAASR